MEKNAKDSFVKNDSDVVAGIATPGSANQITKPAALEKKFIPAPVRNNAAVIKENLPLKNEAAAVENGASGEVFAMRDDSALQVENSETASVLESEAGGLKTKMWFFIALASGIFGAAGFFFLRRIASE